MSDYTVPPPAVTQWDTAAVADGALERFRLLGDDVDADRVVQQAAVACEQVDKLVDRTQVDDETPLDPTAGMVEAAIAATVELYNGGPLSVAAPDATGPGTVRQLAGGARQRWGVA